MALILNIDTATSVCSVALAKDGEVVGCLENNEGLNHSVLLGVYIIGVSTAKGLCFGSGKPLIAVPTLQALANAVARECREDALYCPMLDARRMEVYTAVFDRDNRTVLDTRAEIITPDSFSDLLAMRKVCFFGNGSDKVRDLLASPNACFISGMETSARHLAPLAEAAFRAGIFVDTAYFEPFYLKDFIATVPKKKVIS